MSLRDDLLPLVDDLRQLPTDFGLRRYALVVRTRSWSGARVGEGTVTNSDTTITPPPKVRTVTAAEVFGSGGRYKNTDFRVEKITPAYSGGGYTPAQLRPVVAATVFNRDVVYRLTGDEGTTECTLVDGPYLHRSFGYWMILRSIQGPTRG